MSLDNDNCGNFSASSLSRREMMLATGLATLSIDANGQAKALRTSRSFTLWDTPTHAGGHLQDVDFSAGRFYYLRRAGTEKGDITGCKSASGEFFWSKVLPGRQYTSLAARSSTGSLILHRIGGGLEEYSTASGERTRTIKVWKESGFQALVGSWLIAARPDASVEVLNIESNFVVQAQHKLPVPAVPSAASLSLEQVSGDEVLILNRHTAEGIKLRLRDGVHTRFQCTAPEIQAAKEKYSMHHRSAAAATGKEVPLNPLILPATGHDNAGRIYALVAPYRLESALILVIDASGHAVDRIWCVLPDRKLAEYGSLARIFLSGHEMYLVYSGGGVVVFQVR